MATVEMERATLMKAAVRRVYGEADVVHVEQVGRPSIARNEVLVRVHAAGVDRGVWHLMTGLPYLFRTAGIGVRTPKDPSLGMDLAGVVEAVGGDVTKFRPGDEVFGVGAGSFAEYARARADRLAIKPANLTFEEAAAVAVSASTALLAVRDHGHVQSGQEVLVIGASGGVGSYAVQIAKAFGARVTGVCSPSKLELVRLLGADAVIDYTQADFAAGGKRYDVVIDTGGSSPLPRLRQVLAPRGTLVIVGGEGGGRWFGGMGRPLRAMVLSTFGPQKMGTFIATQKSDDLHTLKLLIESGKVKPALERTYDLAEAADAIRHVAEGHARGKVVLKIVA
ncbi:MAG TPA: NAD(P)-dependent alcohol dehydrogenase [Candidatus Dormibacteraeota bacterium]|nr:NAD(P)-dependent alcohol dehydrogenase [Candidatus Dormibacteraeota bacterium]